MSVAQRSGFTLELVEWRPRLPTVDDVEASPDQVAVVDEVAPNPRGGRAYYALLAHDPPVLRERTALFNAVMYGSSGVRRSDRELAAVATSRVNGCIYCASVHARLFAQLTKDAETIQRLLNDGVDAPLDERERAVVDFAVKVARDPAGLGAADLAPLRQAGLSDLEILDVTHAAAMFAWANRLMQTLGQSVPPAPAT
ncbi:MAG: peroxidase-related enzyme [Thermomicrobiales bacterium]